LVRNWPQGAEELSVRGGYQEPLHRKREGQIKQ
jgi:hypothetical protein